MVQSRLQGRPFAQIGGMVQHLHAGQPGQPVEKRLAAGAAAVVDHDDRGEAAALAQLLDEAPQAVVRVVGGDQYRNVHQRSVLF